MRNRNSHRARVETRNSHRSRVVMRNSLRSRDVMRNSHRSRVVMGNSHLSRTETSGVPSWGVATVVTDSTQDALVPPLTEKNTTRL